MNTEPAECTLSSSSLDRACHASAYVILDEPAVVSVLMPDVFTIPVGFGALPSHSKAASSSASSNRQSVRPSLAKILA